MKLAIFSSLTLSLSGLVASSPATTLKARRSCPDAFRFGDPTISPQGAFAPGDPIKITVDLTCAVTNFDIVPQFIDYTIEVLGSANNGFELPIVLARHSIAPGALSDTVSAKIPHQFLFVGAPYQVVTTAVYPENDTDGSVVFLEGKVSFPINITSSVA